MTHIVSIPVGAELLRSPINALPPSTTRDKTATRHIPTAVSIVMALLVTACATDRGDSPMPTPSLTTLAGAEVSLTTTTDDVVWVFPDPPAEDWWAAYRESGAPEACAAEAEWSQDGDLHDPQSARGRHYIECIDQEWPTHFFENWFDFEEWDLFTRPELLAIREELNASLSFFEDLLADVDEGEKPTALLVNILDQTREDLERLEQHLGT